MKKFGMIIGIVAVVALIAAWFAIGVVHQEEGFDKAPVETYTEEEVIVEEPEYDTYSVGNISFEVETGFEEWTDEQLAEIGYVLPYEGYGERTILQRGSQLIDAECIFNAYSSDIQQMIDSYYSDSAWTIEKQETINNDDVECQHLELVTTEWGTGSDGTTTGKDTHADELWFSFDGAVYRVRVDMNAGYKHILESLRYHKE